MSQEKKTSKKSFCYTNKCSVVTLLLVIAAIAVVVLLTLFAKSVRGPATKEKAGLQWWQKNIIYQVYPRSFQDSDGNGIGDLQGIRNRLYYFNDIGVGIVWLSPFYTSPMRDFGYDVSNYTAVDPLFGSMDDFEALMKDAKENGLKVIVDLVPNHCSDEHLWFQQSRYAKPGTKYRDYFIWSNGTVNASGQTVPPNNWQSVFGGPAWTWDNVSGAYFYHQFTPYQPDLNFRNEDVLNEIDNVFRFWLQKGVDGFRIDAIPHLFEAKNLSLNENIDVKKSWQENAGHHNYTRDLDEIYGVVRRWRKVLNEFRNEDGSEKFLVLETSDLTKEMRDKYYAAGGMPFFFELLGVQKSCNAKCLKGIIEHGTSGLPADGWPNFVIGNHDNRRIADKWGEEFVNAWNMLLLTLPGTPTTYYGEEIGMTGMNYTLNDTVDPAALQSQNISQSRDPERSPMQWNNSMQGGFTTNITSWLKVNPDYATRNVEKQNKTDSSVLSIYKLLAKLRTRSAFQNKDIEFANVTDDILAFFRRDESEKYLVVINFGRNGTTINLAELKLESGIVEVNTGNMESKYNVSSLIDHTSITLSPTQGLVLKVK
ncbi:hypothetical protein CHS0354_042015 [Potamilus streckersoni]|uniref:Glycosyl hydrolase family 13 catalytic domain-containing protein n=1 Tax=Potamilus streckersoni TaxID=2493646 RepID=A0AAE0T9T3_9BIVA|nr:hypothetical protein CHS0354_042015 [Potamilus streckersoni]